jgi:hypothetical protein
MEFLRNFIFSFSADVNDDGKYLKALLFITAFKYVFYDSFFFRFHFASFQIPLKTIFI